MIVYSSISVFPQRLGYNARLLQQLSFNQAIRMGSNSYALASFRRQNEDYNYANRKITESIAVHNYIYNNLRNVNTTIKQAKKVKYTIGYVTKIINNSRKLLKYSSEHPDIALTLTKYYRWLVKEALEIKNELNEVVLTGKDGVLMDTYDRGILIDKIYSKVRSINGGLNYICLLIEDRKGKNLIYYIPGIGGYATKDKQLVEGILDKWKLF